MIRSTSSSLKTSIENSPRRGSLAAFITGVYRFFVCLSVLGAALTFLPPWHFLLEWNRLQTPLYGVALGFVALTVCFAHRAFSGFGRGILFFGALAFFGSFVALNGRFFVERPVRGFPPQSSDLSLEVLSVPVRADSRPEEIAVLLRGAPDVVGLWGPGAGDLARTLQSSAGQFRGVLIADRVALLSRYPLLDSGRSGLGEDASPGLAATVALPGERTVLVGIFDLPLLRDSATMIRNRRAVRRVATEARHATAGVLVMGGIAGRLGGYLYSILIHGSGLEDAAWSRGGRLPGDTVPFTRLFSFDHLLSKGVQVRSIEALPWRDGGAKPLRAVVALAGD